MRIFILLISFLLSITISHAVTIGLEVSGIVTDSAGAPINQARVTLKQNGHTASTTSTNTQGEFAITAAEANGLTLMVEAEGFATYERELDLPTSSLRIS